MIVVIANGNLEAAYVIDSFKEEYYLLSNFNKNKRGVKRLIWDIVQF